MNILQVKKSLGSLAKDRKSLTQGLSIERSGFRELNASLIEEPQDSAACQTAAGESEDFDLLGKRPLLVEKPVLSRLESITSIKKLRTVIKSQLENEQSQELHYRRENRLKTEIWKKYMVRRNPSRVSFIVHNMPTIAPRYMSLT